MSIYKVRRGSFVFAAFVAVSVGAGCATTSSPSGGTMQYAQNFEALPVNALWTGVLDTTKPKAYPENSLITSGCGPDGSNCLRIVYRHKDGIHRHPPSDPVFTTIKDKFNPDGLIAWTPSGAKNTNTATDVMQANIMISGNTDGTAKASAQPKPNKAYTLRYDLMFEEGFDFAKGGKLPGFAAQRHDSGCTEEGSVSRDAKNWSVRVMWRPNGRLETYSYDQSRRPGSCGVSSVVDDAPGDPFFETPGVVPKDDKFRFKPGVWYTVRLSLRVNDNDKVLYQKDSSGRLVLDPDTNLPFPIASNGEMSLSVKSRDGAVKRHMIVPNMVLRDECKGPCKTPTDSPESQINGVFFSTFFGGNETKRRTCLSREVPKYPGMTMSRYWDLCKTNWDNEDLLPKLTWEPQTPSAIRFDNIVVSEGYTAAPL